MDERFRPIVTVLAAALALLIVGAMPALGDDEAPEETAARTERPTSLNRPISIKPDFLSPPPERLAPSDEQRAVDYRSNLQGEIKRQERRQIYRRDWRGIDRMRKVRRERARMDRILRR